MIKIFSIPNRPSSNSGYPKYSHSIISFKIIGSRLSRLIGWSRLPFAQAPCEARLPAPSPAPCTLPDTRTSLGERGQEKRRISGVGQLKVGKISRPNTPITQSLGVSENYIKLLYFTNLKLAVIRLVKLHIPRIQFPSFHWRKTVRSL